jgi:hypothetical protein
MKKKSEPSFNASQEDAVDAAYATQKNYMKAANVLTVGSSLCHHHTKAWKITDAARRALNTHNAEHTGTRSVSKEQSD